MTLVDDRILEYLHENEAASPTEMMKGGPIKFSRAYIGRRCRKLQEEGLIREISDATYVITEDGEEYLKGHLDTEDWRYIDKEAGRGAHSDSTEDAASDH
ncbi:winged helix-turn-helix domain-containing protein [Halorubrum xinjiangense]|uniref:winged helix-turn-helix domain-containing protein n=1 Tax=Halorubrum xinjiangense TaxID=261291 RepID=UPI003C6F87C6